MHEGKDIVVMFQWDKTDPTKPIWSQAFSADDGKTWEWNWYMYFSRPAQHVSFYLKRSYLEEHKEHISMRRISLLKKWMEKRKEKIPKISFQIDLLRPKSEQARVAPLFREHSIILAFNRAFNRGGNNHEMIIFEIRIPQIWIFRQRNCS